MSVQVRVFYLFRRKKLRLSLQGLSGGFINQISIFWSHWIRERFVESGTTIKVFTSIETPGDPFTRGAFKVRRRPVNEGAGLAGLRLGTAAVAEFGPQGQELGLWWRLWRHKPMVGEKEEQS